MFRTAKLNEQLRDGTLKAPHDPQDQAFLVLWMTSGNLPDELVDKAAVLATRFARPLALVALTQIASRSKCALHQPPVLNWVMRNQKLLGRGAEVVANTVRYHHG